MTYPVRRRGFLASSASLALIAGTGCGASSRLGPQLTLKGTLVLQGNEPMTTAVLITEDQGRWEIEGAPAAAVRYLQNKVVVVTGVVIDERPAGGRLPTFKVLLLQPASGDR